MTPHLPERISVDPLSGKLVAPQPDPSDIEDLGDGVYYWPGDNSLRTADGKFSNGTGQRVGAEPEKEVWDQLEKNGHVVIRDHVSICDNDGRLRVYDGAIDLGDGRLIGIEVKSGSASLTSDQRRIDKWVNSVGSKGGFVTTVGQFGGQQMTGVYLYVNGQRVN